MIISDTKKVMNKVSFLIHQFLIENGFFYFWERKWDNEKQKGLNARKMRRKTSNFLKKDEKFFDFLIFNNFQLEI